jgi:hypothetical protein
MGGAGSGRRPSPLADKFWEKVARGDPDKCWVWEGYKIPTGYGQIGHEGRPLYAHRVAYTVSRGPIPPGLNVMHTCDTPACCNPRHLKLGTRQDNIRDMYAKGRGAKTRMRKNKPAPEST